MAVIRIPDKAFDEAVRAVEAVACPLMEPKRARAGKSTLGTVIGELKSASHRWRLGLPDRQDQPRSVDGIVLMLEMLETLWQVQLSRHAGGPVSRRQTLEEAQRAVHLAVLLVQWLVDGVLRRVES